MAGWYIYSGAAGAGTGADWANAYTTLAAALTAKAAGDDFWVADDHAETQATAMTLTSPGTAASPCRIICVRRSGGSVPPASANLRTTATVSTTAASAINFTGFAYCYGVTFSAGSAANAAGINFGPIIPAWWRFEACKLKLSNTSTTSRMTFGTNQTVTDDQLLELVNTVLEFGSVSQGVAVRCPFRWWNTASAIAGTVPTTLFLTAATGLSGFAELRGVDLSAAGSGKNLVDVAPASYTRYLLERCKLGASVAITTGAVPGQGGVEVVLINCDSADTNYRYQRTTYQGTITQETTIVRTGGASDGVTPVSRKMVSSANAKFFSPLESEPILFWNETVGSAITVTVEVVTDNVTLTDAEAWLEVEGLGTSGFPLATFASDRAADILATGANRDLVERDLDHDGTDNARQAVPERHLHAPREGADTGARLPGETQHHALLRPPRDGGDGAGVDAGCQRLSE